MNTTLHLRWVYKKMRESLMLAVELADQLDDMRDAEHVGMGMQPAVGVGR